MKRPEKNFWIYVAMLSSILLLGMSGQLLSCASAHPGSRRAPPEPQAWTAPWNQAGPTVQSQPEVNLKAQLDRGAILQNGDGIVRVEVTVNTPSNVQAQGAPATDIVVVVDTSGSMEGEKLQIAQEALRTLIQRLTPEDRFGLVEYSDYARVLVPLQHATASAKESFYSITYGLQATGSTNLGEGLDSGVGLLRSAHAMNRSGRVLLLSDGLANAGDSSLGGLTARARSAAMSGIAVTTIGVGVDFDENLMTALSTAGTGAFYYIAKMEYLAEFFDAELRSSRDTYAQSAEVVITTAPGVRLVDAMGLPTDARMGGDHSVRVGNLYSNRERSVWLTLQVPSSSLGAKDLGVISLRYERNGQANTVSVGRLPHVLCLNDETLYHQNIHRPVWERALLDDVFNRTQEQYGDAIRSGDRAELARAQHSAEKERVLAQKLGSQAVISKLDQLKTEANVAEQAQTAAPEERNRAAKASKARGYQSRNKGAFDSGASFTESY